MPESEADSESESSLMREIMIVGQAAAKSGGQVEGANSDSHCLKFLEQNDLLQRHNNGEIVISSELYAFGTTWSNAVLESTTRNSKTGFEVRISLLESGWREVSSARKASLQQKK